MPIPDTQLSIKPIQAKFRSGYLVAPEGVDVFFEDPEESFFSAEFDSQDPNRNMTFFGLQVYPEIRERKIGTRLVSALAYAALSKGVTALNGSVESQYVLKIFRNLFGEDNLSYYEVDPNDEDVDLPITTDQAIEILEGYEAKEEDLEHRTLGFGVMIDLSNINPQTLERPLEVK